MKNGIAYKKLLLIGDSKVGKTCFIKKMQFGNFIAEYAKTESIFIYLILISNRDFPP